MSKSAEAKMYGSQFQERPEHAQANSRGWLSRLCTKRSAPAGGMYIDAFQSKDKRS